VPDKSAIETLLKYGELRGSDSVGFCIIGKYDNICTVVDSQKIQGKSNADEMSKRIVSSMNLGDIVLVNHRAAPETEPEVTGRSTIQPIIDEENNIALIHNGSVSSFIYNELKAHFEPKSDLDSEAIIWAYLYFGRNMRRAMEYLSGGFSFILVDMNKEKIYSVASHGPLFSGYVKGHGLFFSSMRNGIYATVSKLKGMPIERQNIFVWEDYYCRSIPEYSISEIDIPSGSINEFSFTPRYIHPKWDPLKNVGGRQKVLVSASGGLDSSTTLAILKKSGYDVTAVHFKYGHRGQDCEEVAVENVCKILDIELVKFDIENNMNVLDSDSMLISKDHKITTGTEKDLKTTIAWTCFRNGLFVSYMGALAESLIINKGYGDVYLTGGFMNLSESSTYPDNSERFIDSFMKFAKFASIAGTRIKPLYACANLLKVEQYILLNKLGCLKEISPWLISCDRPMLINGIPHNCSKDGKPACGSGLLSWWASKMAGVDDLRNYYEVEDEEYKAFEPKSTFNVKQVKIEDILAKLQIDPLNIRILQRKLM
jgi:7-cyano-7-deazaguanine synthase